MFDAGAQEPAIPKSLDMCSLKLYLESTRDLALKDIYRVPGEFLNTVYNMPYDTKTQ
jgi:hypothetical protein